MQHIKLSIEKAFGFVSEQAVADYKTQVTKANASLHNGTGKGSDFLGWLNLPTSIDEAHLADVENTAKILRDNCEIVVVIGIGGSYLGAKAVIDACPTVSIGCRLSAHRLQWFMPGKISAKIISTNFRSF